MIPAVLVAGAAVAAAFLASLVAIAVASITEPRRLASGGTQTW